MTGKHRRDDDSDEQPEEPIDMGYMSLPKELQEAVDRHLTDPSTGRPLPQRRPPRIPEQRQPAE